MWAGLISTDPPRAVLLHAVFSQLRGEGFSF